MQFAGPMPMGTGDLMHRNTKHFLHTRALWAAEVDTNCEYQCHPRTAQQGPGVAAPGLGTCRLDRTQPQHHCHYCTQLDADAAA